MDPATLEHLIVREIRKANEISRRDLAEQLQIAKSTAGRRVDHLIDRGLIREKGTEDKQEAGRPRRLLEIRPEHGYFLGFDFDARNLFAVLTDFAQNTVHRQQVRLPENPTRKGVLNRIRKLKESLSLSDQKTPLLGIGLGVPGRINREEKTALDYPYIRGWKNVDLAAELGVSKEKLYVENNTRAIALGEYWLGPHAISENMACLSIRTGISVAVIANGQLLQGAHGLAGEIRGWTAPTGKKRASIPTRLEEVATVRAVSPDGSVARDEWKRFVHGCREKQKSSLKHLTSIAQHHGEAISQIVQLIDPSVVFLSGSFNELGDVYLDLVKKATEAALDGQYFSPPPMKLVTLGDFTGAHGAAALAAEHVRIS